MKPRVLIGGIGNVLLGDDAVGPYVVRMLESRYSFDDAIEIADLGTPALDLTHRIAGQDAVILIDCVACADYAPGALLEYRKADILRVAPAQRLDPHSPALSECIMTAEMLGASPQDVLLVGIVGRNFEPGRPLSHAVRAAVNGAVDAVIAELARLGVDSRKRTLGEEPDLWWCDPEAEHPPSLPISARMEG
ncbi:MAG TPA: hydrogenase maturation protease [Candidatus Sulfotelmatobacter sp.]|nr:hydrogenase maturation protease [Candidatus Sulfotelmatobacter sp.]